MDEHYLILQLDHYQDRLMCLRRRLRKQNLLAFLGGAIAGMILVNYGVL
jgi:hypothetical protein